MLLLSFFYKYHKSHVHCFALTFGGNHGLIPNKTCLILSSCLNILSCFFFILVVSLQFDIFQNCRNKGILCSHKKSSNFLLKNTCVHWESLSTSQIDVLSIQAIYPIRRWYYFFFRMFEPFLSMFCVYSLVST